jgi:type II secretory pathway component GspD/PulD (secretin)
MNVRESQHSSIFLLPALLVLLLLLTGATNTATATTDKVTVIHFSKGSHRIAPADVAVLQRLATTLAAEDVTTILVEGFSDAQPPQRNRPFADNRELSQLRADAVARRLQELSSLPESLFISIGRGAANPVATNDTAAGQAANRRVEISINRAASGTDAGGDSEPERSDLQATTDDHDITVTFKDVPIAEAFAMLSKKERVNIILGKGVTGTISASLYNVTLEEAVLSLAESAGYRVAKQYQGYAILSKESGDDESSATVIRTFKIQYSDPEKVKDILTAHKSEAGKITVLKDRDLLVVEDRPESISRIEQLLQELDKKPQQILIEAKILEITLDDTETFGLDWARIFKEAGGHVSFGMQGLASKTATGFVAQLPDGDDITFVLNLLNEKGRVHTLSTPKLLALENQEAEVIIGDRQGYAVTTTINQVTTESIEFLESGIILKVRPSVDEQGRILMSIHPEISSGAIANGIPSQTTTEVTTDLLADDGQPIFIGGLIKNSTDRSRDGVPVLGDLPLVGRLFSKTKDIVTNKETVVLITPHIVHDKNRTLFNESINKVDQVEKKLEKQRLPADPTSRSGIDDVSSRPKTDAPSDLP